MIFQYTHDLVLSGRKTQTRRLHRPRVVAGRDYAVQPGRSKRAIGRIVVTDVRQERLGDISAEDARAEGYDSRAAFFEGWRRIHGSVDKSVEVWVVEFRLQAPNPVD